MILIEPAQGTATLLVIAALAILLLLFFIMRLKLQAFIVPVLVSLATALVSGIPWPG